MPQEGFLRKLPGRSASKADAYVVHCLVRLFFTGLSRVAFLIVGQKMPLFHTSRKGGRSDVILLGPSRESEHELMALFGWENAEMARVYTRKAAQKKLAVSAAAKMSKIVLQGDLRVPPEKKMSLNNDLKR